jgi:hypothetical protein
MMPNDVGVDVPVRGSDPMPGEPLSELEYARRLLQVFGGRLRYVPARAAMVGMERPVDVLDPATLRRPLADAVPEFWDVSACERMLSRERHPGHLAAGQHGLASQVIQTRRGHGPSLTDHASHSTEPDRALCRSSDSPRPSRAALAAKGHPTRPTPISGTDAG